MKRKCVIPGKYCSPVSLPIRLAGIIGVLLEVAPYEGACAAEKAFDNHQRHRVSKSHREGEGREGKDGEPGRGMS